MTLLDAQPFDTARARSTEDQNRGRRYFHTRSGRRRMDVPELAEERVVSNFFAALQKQDYESAYALYFNDPAWRQHQQKYSQYPYADFYRDWGPGGEWGLIKSYRIYGTANTQGFMSGGVIVEVIVNDRAEHARMFVERSKKTITVYPY